MSGLDLKPLLEASPEHAQLALSYPVWPGECPIGSSWTSGSSVLGDGVALVDP